MKKCTIIFSVLFVSFASDLCASKHTRLTKKDKDELMQLIGEPLNNLEKSFEQLSIITQFFENFAQIFFADEDDEIDNAQLAGIDQKLDDILLELQNLSSIVGNDTDQSVGQEEFDSVTDIDNAQLSLIALLKTVYRQQLADKFIS